MKHQCLSLQIQTLNGETRQIELFDYRTVSEAIAMADPECTQPTSVFSQGQVVNKWTKIGNLSCFNLSVKQYLKRKASQPSSVMLEIVSLSGSATFIPTIDSFTIRQALQSAAYSENLIACLKPEVNRRLVNLDSLISDLQVPAIRLRAFPLKGGGGKGGGKMKGEQMLRTDPWAAFTASSSSNASNAMGGSARWDQLELLKDHPWHIKGGERIPQVKLLQIRNISSIKCL